MLLLGGGDSSQAPTLVLFVDWPDPFSSPQVFPSAGLGVMPPGEEALFGAKSWGIPHPLPISGCRRACGKLRAVIFTHLPKWKPSATRFVRVPPAPLPPASLLVAALTPLSYGSSHHGEHDPRLTQHRRPPDSPIPGLSLTPSSGPPAPIAMGLPGLLLDLCS